jgi:hypothetical protein
VAELEAWKPTLLGMGDDVILDFGFWSPGWSRSGSATGNSRPRHRSSLRSSDVRRMARGTLRLAEHPSCGSFVIDLSVYEALKVYFEPLTSR